MPRSVTLFLVVSIVATIFLAFFTEAHAENNVVVTASTNIGVDTFTAKKCRSNYCRRATVQGSPATKRVLDAENAKFSAQQLARHMSNSTIESRIKWLVETSLPNPSQGHQQLGIVSCAAALNEMRTLINRYTGTGLDLRPSSNCREFQQLVLVATK